MYCYSTIITIITHYFPLLLGLVFLAAVITDCCQTWGNSVPFSDLMFLPCQTEVLGELQGWHQHGARYMEATR